MSEKLIENVSALDDALLWVAFARRFLAADSYRYGARVADALGAQGASAVAIVLRRLSTRLAERDAFACVEASCILCGEVEDIESLEAIL
jgi:hypothetical protein